MSARYWRKNERDVKERRLELTRNTAMATMLREGQVPSNVRQDLIDRERERDEASTERRQPRRNE